MFFDIGVGDGSVSVLELFLVVVIFDYRFANDDNSNFFWGLLLFYCWCCLNCSRLFFFFNFFNNLKRFLISRYQLFHHWSHIAGNDRPRLLHSLSRSLQRFNNGCRCFDLLNILIWFSDWLCPTKTRLMFDCASFSSCD